MVFKMHVYKIALLGNKDHGKSTTIGSLLMLTKSISEARIEEAKRISKELNRPFEPGFLLDSFSEEREDAMTIDTTRAQIQYKGKGFEFIDVPGHEELIKNMLSGAAYADFALAIVSAAPNEGISNQTKRHIFIANLIGINKIIVAVNKMDAVNYDENRFNEIKKEITDYLIKIGVKNRDIKFIPISAYRGDNLVEKSSNMNWYNEDPLIDLLHKTSSKKKKTNNKIFSAIIQGNITTEKGELIAGKVISGAVNLNDTVVIEPDDIESKVEILYVAGKEKEKAKAGNEIALKLDKDINVEGRVLCSRNEEIKSMRSLNVRAFFVDVPKEDKLKIKINNNEVYGLTKIIDSIDTSSGNHFSDNKIRALEAADLDINLDKPVAAAKFNSIPELGKLLFYEEGKFIGIGIII